MERETPFSLPLRINSSKDFSEIVDSVGRHIAEIFAEVAMDLEQAEFIVRAVNAHDRLIAALKPFVAILQVMRPPEWMKEDMAFYSRDDVKLTLGDLKRAASAISQAEPKPKENSDG